MGGGKDGRREANAKATQLGVIINPDLDIKRRHANASYSQCEY